MNFDEQILEAAKSIMNAASALITAATSAQKELVAQGKVRSVRKKAVSLSTSSTAWNIHQLINVTYIFNAILLGHFDRYRRLIRKWYDLSETNTLSALSCISASPRFFSLSLFYQIDHLVSFRLAFI